MAKKTPAKKATEKAAPKQVGAATLDAMRKELAGPEEEPKDFTDVLVPAGSVRTSLRIRQLRRKTKYLCGRMRKEAVEGVEAPKLPDGFKEFYEAQEWFDGWDMYNTSWDIEQVFDAEMNPIVDEFRPLLTVARWESVWEEWEQVIDDHVKNDIISARKRKRMGQPAAKPVEEPEEA